MRDNHAKCKLTSSYVNCTQDRMQHQVPYGQTIIFLSPSDILVLLLILLPKEGQWNPKKLSFSNLYNVMRVMQSNSPCCHQGSTIRTLRLHDHVPVAQVSNTKTYNYFPMQNSFPTLPSKKKRDLQTIQSLRKYRCDFLKQKFHSLASRETLHHMEPIEISNNIAASLMWRCLFRIVELCLRWKIWLKLNE